MKLKRIVAAVLVSALLFVGATALAAGTAADPLVSRSYLETVFSQPMENYWNTAGSMLALSLESSREVWQKAAQEAVNARIAAALTPVLTQQVQLRAEQLLAQQSTAALTAGMRRVTLKKGDCITGTPGAAMVFVTGAGKTCGSTGAEILNVTAGSTRKPGLAIKTGILYMILADDGSGIEVTSDTAVVLVKDGARAGYEEQYTACADALKQLGLFLGDGSGYALNRAPGRMEALVMLIRLLGEESAALECTAAYPFKDLPTWQNGTLYITYGYLQGYSRGTGNNTFSPYDNTALEQYLTFVLRSLGYQDGVDFVWNQSSVTLARTLGLLTESELESIRQTGFYRDHVVLISWRALSARRKDGITLAEWLMNRGVFTGSQMQEASLLAAGY